MVPGHTPYGGTRREAVDPGITAANAQPWGVEGHTAGEAFDSTATLTNLGSQQNSKQLQGLLIIFWCPENPNPVAEFGTT